MRGPIVVGTDGSATAALAVERAIELARAFQQPLHLVSAYPAERGGPEPGLPHDLAQMTTARAAVEAMLEATARAAQSHGVETVQHAVEGDPADAILGVAERQAADLIVVGNVGISSKRRFLLGNVPSKVVHNAPCGVHVVQTSQLSAASG